MVLGIRNTSLCEAKKIEVEIKTGDQIKQLFNHNQYFYNSNKSNKIQKNAYVTT